MGYDKEKARAAYMQKLRDPRWQKMRLKIMERDGFECQNCGDSESTLNVHHRDYERGKEPWDYPEDWLITFCETCHQEETESRPGEEKSLLHVLRLKGYLSADLSDLLIAFHNSKYIPNGYFSALCWAIESDEIISELVDRYFEHLRKKHEKQIGQIAVDGQPEAKNVGDA